jgi:hypothetical protein
MNKRSLVHAAESRRLEERSRSLDHVIDVVRAERVCSVCRSAILRKNNISGVCRACSRAHRSTSRCTCGRTLDPSNRTGRCTSCRGPWLLVLLEACRQEPNLPESIRRIVAR